MTKSQIAMLAVFVTLAFLGAVPAMWIDSRSFFAELNKPAWAPPAWLFRPVWTLLYVTIGVAAWGVWRRAWWSAALVPWFIQLVLNIAWTPIFFGLREPGWAALEIVALWLATVATLIAFARVASWTAWLLAPYIAWVSFAAALNFSIWRLNA